MDSPEYLTVGEFARRVGVTVRTIQYYDQKGLLSPSAKGPRNERLYTEDDVTALYRILTLKYVGLSLAEIESEGSRFSEMPSFHLLIEDKMDAIEEDFQRLFKRLTTMNALIKASNEPGEVDWRAMARLIEKEQDDSAFFWRLICVNENSLADGARDESTQRDKSIARWHDLIAETLRLMTSGEPLDSPSNRNLARRYLELEKAQGASAAEQFILMENISPHGVRGGKDEDDSSFDSLRRSVCEHLDAVVEALRSGVDDAKGDG